MSGSGDHGHYDKYIDNIWLDFGLRDCHTLKDTHAPFNTLMIKKYNVYA